VRGDLRAVRARDGVSFEGEPPTPAQMAERIAAATRTHAWVVHEDDDRIVGYAYGGPHQRRAAYRFSCEVSVYVEQGRRHTGSGRALYEALFKRLAARGYRMAVAGMTLPNEASTGLHRAMGFEPVGVYQRIGWKLGAWHDVAWMQRALRPEGRVSSWTACRATCPPRRIIGCPTERRKP
jgi:L-amino acid N-acyltransferase YncA